MGNNLRKKTCYNCGRIIGYTDKCICRSTKGRIGRKTTRRDNRFYSSYKWQKLRKEIVKRDNGYCQRCIKIYNRIETDDLQVHHIKSREHYPELEYDKSNLITVCRHCNLKLGTKDKLDFEWSNLDEDYEFTL